MLRYRIKYQFQPKSIAYMKEGQFWPIPLAGGKFACGRVLMFPEDKGHGKGKGFLAGLMDWSGSEEPNELSIANSRILEQGIFHIKTIIAFNRSIIGISELSLDGIEPYLWCEHRDGRQWGLYRGYKLVRIIDREEAKKYPRMKTWGFDVINILAEKKLGKQEAPGVDGCRLSL